MKHVTPLMIGVALLAAAAGGQSAPPEEPGNTAQRPLLESDEHALRAGDLFRLGRYSEAAKEQRRAIELWRRAVDGPTPWLVVAHVNLARFYAEAGEFSAAEKEVRYVLGELGDRVPDRSATRAMACNVLSRVAAASGNWKEAEERQQEVVVLLERDPSSNPLLLATALSDLAFVKAGSGNLGRARPLLVRALAIHRTVRPTHAQAYGRILVNFGWLCFKQGDFAAAAPLYDEGIAVLEGDLGPNDPTICAALAGQAALFRKTGRKREAKEIEKRIRAAVAEAPERFRPPGTIDVLALKR